MRINKYLASATSLSRRAADQAISGGKVFINGSKASLGDIVTGKDIVTLDGRAITPPVKSTTLILNKPAGYVVSRNGQGSRTVYDLLPEEYRSLKPVGRLDKDSSGLLLMTDDGEKANHLTHPRFAKTKIYEITIDKPLEPLHHQMINDYGVRLEDGPSKLTLHKLDESGENWQVTMTEGRNRQIRRTFHALGYEVTDLHRTNFGEYQLENLQAGQFTELA